MSVLKRYNGSEWETIGPAIIGRAGTIPNDSEVEGPYIKQALNKLKEQIDILNSSGLEPEEDFIAETIESWLDSHPEATTTVEDHSLTYEKFSEGVIQYITPEAFGAVGDGIHDDTSAFEEAFHVLDGLENNRVTLVCRPGAVYFFEGIINCRSINRTLTFDGNNATFINMRLEFAINSNYTPLTEKASLNLITIKDCIFMPSVAENDLKDAENTYDNVVNHALWPVVIGGIGLRLDNCKLVNQFVAVGLTQSYIDLFSMTDCRLFYQANRTLPNYVPLPSNVFNYNAVMGIAENGVLTRQVSNGDNWRFVSCYNFCIDRKYKSYEQYGANSEYYGLVDCYSQLTAKFIQCNCCNIKLRNNSSATFENCHWEQDVHGVTLSNPEYYHNNCIFINCYWYSCVRMPYNKFATYIGCKIYNNYNPNNYGIPKINSSLIQDTNCYNVLLGMELINDKIGQTESLIPRSLPYINSIEEELDIGSNYIDINENKPISIMTKNAQNYNDAINGKFDIIVYYRNTNIKDKSNDLLYSVRQVRSNVDLTNKQVVITIKNAKPCILDIYLHGKDNVNPDLDPSAPKIYNYYKGQIYNNQKGNITITTHGNTYFSWKIDTSIYLTNNSLKPIYPQQDTFQKFTSGNSNYLYDLDGGYSSNSNRQKIYQINKGLFVDLAEPSQSAINPQTGITTIPSNYINTHQSLNDVVFISQPTSYIVDTFDSATYLFSVEAARVSNGSYSSEGLTYLWQYSNDGENSWYTSTNQGTPVTTPSILRTFQDTNFINRYRCIVTNENGDKFISNPGRFMSSNENIKTIVSKPIIVSQPTNFIGPIGSSAYFTVSASGDADKIGQLSYQWQSSLDKGLTWNNSTRPGQDSSTFGPLEVTQSRIDNYVYRCLVKDSNFVEVPTSIVRIIEG